MYDRFETHNLMGEWVSGRVENIINRMERGWEKFAMEIGDWGGGLGGRDSIVKKTLLEVM